MDSSPFAVAQRAKIRTNALDRDGISPGAMFDHQRPGKPTKTPTVPVTFRPADEAHFELSDYLDGLTPREQQVLALRYAVWGGPRLTQMATAAELGISRQRVATIEASALEKLRQHRAA